MKALIPILLLGLGLRLVLIPFSLHPDFRAVNLAADLIAQQGHILDFYDYLRLLPRTNPLISLYGDGLFIYPPLAYLSHAVFNLFLRPFYPQEAFSTLIFDIGQLRQTSGFSVLMYLLKLPYLLADICGLILIIKLLPAQQRKMGSLLWWFNPITLYSAYLVGQFDIFIAVLLLAGVLIAAKKPLLTAVCLGLAAGFKPMSLLLLPFLPGKKTVAVFVGLLTFGLQILPYLSSVGFRQYALLASQSDKLLFAKIAVSGSQFLPLFIVGWVALFWCSLVHFRSLPVWGWWTAVLLLFFSLTHYHPQWFTWLVPLLLLSFLQHRQTRWPILVLLGCYLAVVLSFDTSLNFGLFGGSFALPIADVWISVIRGIFAGTSVYLVHLLVRHDSRPA